MTDYLQAREAAIFGMADDIERIARKWEWKCDRDQAVECARDALDVLLALRLTTSECPECREHPGFRSERRDRKCWAGCDAGRVAGEKVLTVLGMGE